MPFQSQNKEEQPSNLPVYEMVTCCGITLPKVKDIMDFPPVQRAKISDILLGYSRILSDVFSNTKFKTTSEDSIVYVLKMFAAWTEHPAVKKEDKLTFEGLWLLLNPQDENSPRMSDEDLKLITECVRDLVEPLISKEGADSPKAKRKTKAKAPSKLTN